MHCLYQSVWSVSLPWCGGGIAGTRKMPDAYVWMLGPIAVTAIVLVLGVCALLLSKMLR